MPKPPPAATATTVSTVAHDPEVVTEFLDWQNLPGCTEHDLNEIHVKLAAFLTRDASGAALDAATVEKAFAGLWKKPCLAHVARYGPPPRVTVRGEELKAFVYKESRALLSMAGGFYVRDGQRAFVPPPSLPLPLTPAAQKRLAPWLCPAAATECGHAATFVERADAAFAARHDAQRVGAAEHPEPAPCSGSVEPEGGSPFEQWIGCLRTSADVTYRYPEARYRAPTSGWLWLRGRRGHYTFEDEIRVYDLRTGAAYVAQRSDGLHLGESTHRTGAAPAATAFAGNVSAEAARELAFALLTAEAPAPHRPEIVRVPVPEGLSITLRPGQPLPKTVPDVGEWGSSNQTELAYDLVDGSGSRGHGRLTWPGSAKPAEDHAAELVRQLEAGFEKGCARAKLPSLPRARDAGAVSRIDADPKVRAGTMSELELAFLGLDHAACPDAR